jgi:hypothetical protein
MDQNNNIEDPTWAPRMVSRRLIITEEIPDQITNQQHIRIPNNEIHIQDLFNIDIPIGIRRELIEQNENFNVNFFLIERFERRIIFENRELNYSSYPLYTKHPNNLIKNFNNQ